MHVVVIGAGIVGAVSAVELLRDGHQVTILEPDEPGGEQAASYGNGGWLSPSSVLPVGSPGLWKKVPGYLADPLGPLTIRWSYLITALPWLTRLLTSGWTWGRVRKTSLGLGPLVAGAPELHLKLATEAGVADLIKRTGQLYVFPTRKDYEDSKESWDIRRERGVKTIEVDENELRQREPHLDRRYTFALYCDDGGHCSNPGAYVAALVHHALSLGATRIHGGAERFEIGGGRLKGVVSGGKLIACDAAVIAAGARSRDLAHQAGDRVVLETERGYHAVIESPEVGPRTPIMPSDGKMVHTPMEAGLRIAGQVEIAGLDAAPNWKRAEVLLNHARRTWPGLPKDLPPERVKVWMGHRPSTPDGLPCIGKATGCKDVVHAYGHGHIGLASGAMTGRLVADIISGKTPTIPIAPFDPSRFN
ncbi:MAG: FAD-binding oxidoreductase [Alphaproteobacteria bacterium]|nr:FAD-binding oxidoreductase [Alphaproteobacteria bacterium]